MLGEFESADESVQQYLERVAPDVATTVNNDQSWFSQVGPLLTGLVSSYQQKQMLDLQIERARAGLPPLDMTGYSGLNASVGLSAGTQKALLMGVGLLAGAYLLPKLLGR